MTDFILIGNEAERIVLRLALSDYFDHSKSRQDPSFIPKPGKKDRHLEAMRLCTAIKEITGTPGTLSVPTGDDERRCIRNALYAYITKAQVSDVQDQSIGTAQRILKRMPDADDFAPPMAEGEASVEYTGQRFLNA